MKVQTRFETTLNGELTDVATTITVDAVPVNTVGYLTIGRGTANEEDIKYLNISGLQLLLCLRGLSKTALTDTEVLGNKKAHSDGETVESTILHYILNNKTDRDEDENITGTWTFDDAKSTTDDPPTDPTHFTNKKYTDDTFVPLSSIDTDNTLSANSDSKIPSQKAIKKFVEDEVAGVADFPQPLATAISDVNATASEINQLSGVSFITDHTTYTPAYLTCGTSGTTNYLLWGALTDGSFRVTIDGVQRDITGINTVGATSMDDIASIIQTAIRAVTSGLETCVWDTDHFVLTSGNTTSSSAITVLSAVGSGTDISGVGAGDPNMDGDAGNGVVTNKVINSSADSGKISKMNSLGFINKNLLSFNLGDDGAIDGASSVTITGSNNTYIIKQYTSWARGVSKTVTTTPTGCVTHIKIAGSADLRGWSFNYSGKGFAGGNYGQGAYPSNATDGTSGTPSTTGTVYGHTAGAYGEGGGGSSSGNDGSGGGGGGGASLYASGTAGVDGVGTYKGLGGSAGVKPTLSFNLSFLPIFKNFFVSPGSGGGGGGGGQTSGGLSAGQGQGGLGGAGGGCLIIEIDGDLIIDSTTIFDMSGVDGGSAQAGATYAGGGGGGGGGGVLVVLVRGTINGTPTIDVSGGTAGTPYNTGGAGGAGGAGQYYLGKNYIA